MNEQANINTYQRRFIYLQYQEGKIQAIIINCIKQKPYQHLKSQQIQFQQDIQTIYTKGNKLLDIMDKNNSPQKQKKSMHQLKQSRKSQFIQKQLYALKYDNNALFKQYNSLRKQQYSLKHDYDTLFWQNNQLKNLSPYILKLQNQGLKRQNLDYQQDIKNLQSYRKQLQHQIMQYKWKQEKNSPNRNKIKVQLGNQDTKIQNSLQNEKSVKKNFIQREKQQALRSDFLTLQRKFKQTQKEQIKLAQQFQAQKQQLNKKINGLQNQQIPSFQRVIQQQNKKIDSQKNQLASIKQEYQKLLHQAQSLNKKLIEMSAHVKQYKIKSDSLQISNQKNLSQLKILKQQKRQLLKCIDDQYKQIKSKGKQYCQLRQNSIPIENIKNQTGIYLPKLAQNSNNLFKKPIQTAKQAKLNMKNNEFQAQQEEIEKQCFILVTINQLNQMTQYKKKYLQSQINSNQNQKTQDNFKSIVFQNQKQQAFNHNSNASEGKYTVTQEQYNEALQQIKKLQAQIKDSKRVNQDIFKRNLQAQSTVDKLVEQNQQFKHRNSILILNEQKTKKQLAKIKQQIVFLQKQIQSLNKQIFQQKSEKSKLMIMHTNQKQKSQQLEGKLKRQTDDNFKINENLQNKVKQLNDLKAKIQKYKQQRQSDRQNMQIKYNQLIQKQQYYKQQAQKYKKACLENNVIIGQITENQEKYKLEAISIKEQQIKDLKVKLKQLSHQFSLQQEKIKELRQLAVGRLTQLKKKEKQLQSSITGNNILKNQISVLQQSNLQLQKDIESKQNIIKLLNENIRNHASIKKEYQSRLDQQTIIVTSNNTLKKQNQNLLIKQKEVQAEKQEQSRLKNQQIQLKNEEVQKGKQELKRLKSELNFKEMKLQRAQQQLLLKKQQNNSMVSSSSMQAQMKELKKKLEQQIQEQLQKQTKFMQDQLKVLKEQIKQLKKQNDSSSIQKSKLKKLIESLQQEKETLNNQMKGITVDYRSQKNQVSNLISSRNSLIKQNEEMMKQIVKLNQEIKKFGSQSSQLNSLLHKIKLRESQNQLLKIQLQSCKDRHQSQIKNLRESLEKLENNDLASTDQIQELKKQKEQIKNRANTLQKQLKQRNQQNQMLKDENQFVKEENQNFKNLISQSNRKSQLQRTKNLRKQQFENNVQQQITHLNKQITKLTNESSQQQQLILKMSLQKEKIQLELQNKCDTEWQKSKDMEIKNQQLKKQIDQIKINFIQVQKKVADKDQSLQLKQKNTQIQKLKILFQYFKQQNIKLQSMKNQNTQEWILNVIDVIRSKSSEFSRIISNLKPQNQNLASNYNISAQISLIHSAQSTPSQNKDNKNSHILTQQQFLKSISTNPLLLLSIDDFNNCKKDEYKNKLKEQSKQQQKALQFVNQLNNWIQNIILYFYNFAKLKNLCINENKNKDV